MQYEEEEEDNRPKNRILDYYLLKKRAITWEYRSLKVI